MAQPGIVVGFSGAPKPPISGVRHSPRLARLPRFDCFMVWDHLPDFVPSALWDRRLSDDRMRRQPA